MTQEERVSAGPCSVKGCVHPASAAGLCGAHYERKRNSGRVGNASVRTLIPRVGVCGVADCDRLVKCAGYCRTHYGRIRLTGSPGGPIRDRRRPECVVEGCTSKPCGQDLCRMHYERKRRGGDLGLAAPLQRPRGSGALSHGYVIVTIDGRARAEHRHIMEQLLGRQLQRYETVHHVNGQRSDNRTAGPLENFRSGNLELWSSWQPAGQRVADKVAFAVSLLREYAPDLLSPGNPRNNDPSNLEIMEVPEEQS